jgi:hypothetical protein
MAAIVLKKSYEEALAEYKAAPPELQPQSQEPLKVVGRYETFDTATFAMS